MIAVFFSTVYFRLLEIASCTIAIGFGYLCYVSVGCTPRESVLTEPIERNASASAIGSVTIGRGCHLLILNENSLSNWPWAAFLSVLLNDDSCLKRAVCNGTNSMTERCGHGDCKVFPLMPVNGSTAMEFYAAYEHDFLTSLSEVINTIHSRGKVSVKTNKYRQLQQTKQS